MSNILENVRENQVPRGLLKSGKVTDINIQSAKKMVLAELNNITSTKFGTNLSEVVDKTEKLFLANSNVDGSKTVWNSLNYSFPSTNAVVCDLFYHMDFPACACSSECFKSDYDIWFELLEESDHVLQSVIRCAHREHDVDLAWSSTGVDDSECKLIHSPPLPFVEIKDEQPTVGNSMLCEMDKVPEILDNFCMAGSQVS